LTGENESTEGNFWTYFFLSNFKSKIVAFLIAFILWSSIVAQTGIIREEYEIPLSFQLLPSKYEIDSDIVKTKINVTLKGKSPDITSLDKTKIEIKIDAKNLQPGENQIELTPQMIPIPSFLSVEKIEPENIIVIIREEQKEQSILDGNLAQ